MIKLRRKLTSVVSALAVLFFVLGATNPATAADAGNGTVTLWVGSWWDTQVPILQKLWQADHPDIKLDAQPLPINGYLDKFTSAALAGAPPDIIDLDTTWLSTVAAQGLLQPLTDVAAALDVSDISPSMWAAGHYKNVPYAIPSRGGPEVWYYNKTVFDKAGVAYPTADWTHDDLLRIARALTIPGVQYGIGIPADLSDPSNVLSMFCPMLWYFGGDFLNADNTAPAINDENSVKALTYWSDFYLEYGASPEGTPNFAGTRDIEPLFEANKIGLMVGASNEFDTFSKKSGLRWGAITAPDKINLADGWTMGIPVGAQNPAGAKDFIEWFAKPAIQAAVLNRFPASLAARKIAPWNDPKFDLFSKAELDARAVPSVAGWFQIQTVVITQLQKILVKQSTPQQAADAAAAQIAQIIVENK